MTTGSKTIRVLLADDHEMVRQGLAQILEETSGVEVVGQVGDGATALDAALRLRPDVLVLDYSMPEMDAPSVVQHLRRELEGTRILVLTIHENLHYAVKILEVGAHGYVVKSAAVRELVDAIRAVQGGEVYLSKEMSQKVLHHMRSKKGKGGVDTLSPREFDVLRDLGSGATLSECADRLNVSTSTVSTYRSRLLEKLGLETTADIIRFAIENDIVP